MEDILKAPTCVCCLLRHYVKLIDWLQRTSGVKLNRLVVIKDERESMMIFQEKIPGTRSRMGKFP